MSPEPTLPDWIGPGLNILSVGLNPSLRSVREGFPFATPQNRFWKALNASDLIDELLEPGVPAMQRLFEQHRIGFTDVVKRPTPGAAQLRTADFKTWAPVLTEKLLTYAPRVVWFHGKLAYRDYLKHGLLEVSRSDAEKLEWGLQPLRIGKSQVFMTPNPSPANAAYSLDALILWYRKLAALISSE
ncbi:MAG: mismatch-specific DNA-glycosylase [Gammaproteobacteria bacterium]|nr:mismatch-specific DNA-glycosylase [Gammaproteobacteria bacterium]MBU2479193.1 mismatch-specific DNA-glycosylase [Gammaproteobacteria bacterium]